MNLLGLAAVALGIPVGLLLARLSARAGDEAPTPRRLAAFALAAPALAVWAQAAHPGAAGVLGALLAWQLLLLAVLDAEHLWLPLPATLSLIATGLLAAAALGPDELAPRAAGAALGWIALAGLAAAYRRLRGREGLGGGDAVLLAGGGAWAGWAALPTILVWAALAGLSAVAVLAFAGRPVARTRELPFGVALALGVWLAWLYGPMGRI